MSEELKRIGLRAIFDIKDYISNSEVYSRVTEKVAQVTGAAAAKMRQNSVRMAEAAGSSAKTMAEDIRLALESGIGVDTIARTFGMSASEVMKYAKAAEQANKSTADLASSSDKTSKSIFRLIKRTTLWILGVRTVFTAYNKVRRELIEGIKDIFQTTEEYKRLADASERVRNSFILMLLPAEKFRNLMDQTAGVLEKASDDFLRMGAFIQADIATIDSFTEAIWVLDNALQALMVSGTDAQKTLMTFQMLELGRVASETDRLSTFTDVYNKTLAENKKVLEESLVETQDYDRALKDIISTAQRFDEELGRHAERIQEINDAYRVAQLGAQGDYFRQMEDINRRLAEDIGDINTDAFKDREAALADFQDRMAKAERDGARDQLRDAERHALQMEFMRRHHQLEVLQSERRYQADRNRLIADGDVLAIEELDERHAIEKQEREENYQLQREQAEAMFRLQARIMAEANRQQAAEMRQALAEQLAMIEERRLERIEEVKKGADEERAEALQAAAERLSDAKASQIEELASEEKAHQERLDDLGEFLREFADKNELTIDQVMRLWQDRYGVGGPIDQALRNAFARYQGYVQAFSASVQAAMQQAGVAGTGGRPVPTRPRGPTPPVPRHYPEGFQFGGEFPLGKGAAFDVGEGGRERVSITPDTLSGGVVMVHRWQGSGIPIDVRGNDGGADLGGLGDAIVQAFVTEMSKQTQRTVGQRGR